LLEKGGKEATPLEVSHLRIKDGVITFHDRFFPREEVVTKLSDTDLSLDQLTWGSKSAFRISAQLGDGASGSFSINGKIKLVRKKSSVWVSTIDQKIFFKHIGEHREMILPEVHHDFVQ